MMMTVVTIAVDRLQRPAVAAKAAAAAVVDGRHIHRESNHVAAAVAAADPGVKGSFLEGPDVGSCGGQLLALPVSSLH
jgi:hypothetical protein